ncbi:MAG TPA: hypothetical protein VMF65_25770, partial [Acidimicrobiales bacterium]|nr:hypothetical protein [Acidimicrobiales bacterium]
MSDTFGSFLQRGPARDGLGAAPGPSGSGRLSSPAQGPQTQGAQASSARAAGPAGLPSITLPQGGGAIKGIDEKLTVGLATGS